MTSIGKENRTRERERERERQRQRETERETDTDTDTWFIVKATDPYTRLDLGGGRWGRG